MLITKTTQDNRRLCVKGETQPLMKIKTASKKYGLESNRPEAYLQN